MPLKVSLFFLQHGQGWSEVYYVQGDDPVAFIALQQPSVAKADSVLVARAKLLSPLASITHIRASVDGAFREEWGIDYGLPGYVGLATRAFLGLPVGLQEPVLPPSVRVEVQSAAQAGAGAIFKKRNFLGGVPADLMNAQGAYGNNPNWNTAVASFMTIGDGRPMQVKSRPFAPTASNLTSFQPAADGLSAILGPDVAIGILDPVFTVNIRGIKNPHGWNGIHRAIHVPNPLVPGASLIQIGPFRKPKVLVPVWNLGDGGTVGLTTPTYHNVTLVAAEGLVKKSTGRPFGVPVGRRSRP